MQLNHDILSWKVSDSVKSSIWLWYPKLKKKWILTKFQNEYGILKNCWNGNNDFQSRDERSNSKIRSIPQLNPGNPNLTFRISWDRQCPLALNYYQFQVLGQQFQAKVYVTLNSPQKCSKKRTIRSSRDNELNNSGTWSMWHVSFRTNC